MFLKDPIAQLAIAPSFIYVQRGCPGIMYREGALEFPWTPLLKRENKYNGYIFVNHKPASTNF